MPSCAACATDKPLDQFHKNKNRANGHTSICKACACAKSRAWGAANSERARESARQYRAANREALTVKKRAFYYDNHEEILAYHAKRRAEKPELVRGYVLAWNKRNAATKLTHSRNYKARKKNAEGKHTLADIKALFASQAGHCAACREALDKYHVDHIVPLIRGGRNDKGNLQLLCAPCNMAKRDKPPEVFMQSRGFLI